MFLYQPDFDPIQLMPKPNSWRSSGFERQDSFISYTNLRDEWNYRLTQKLPDLLTSST